MKRKKNTILESFIELQICGKNEKGRKLTMKESLQRLRHLNEDESTDKGDKMSEEELKIESLKIATNIAKLMSDVVPEDVIKISEKVAEFIRNHEIDVENAKEEEKTEETGLPTQPDETNEIV